MNVMHFGTSARPLFGVYHPPLRRPVRPDAVLVCYPLGHEYMRTHRPLKGLCEALSRDGHHTMRFDYYGTGDAGGDAGEADLAGWLRDVEAAAEELRAISGMPNVSLVGVRLGASLALLAARRLEGVRSVALFDPIVRGRSYLTDLLAAERRSVRDDASARGTEVDAMGYPVPPALRRDLDALDLCRASGLGGFRTALFLTDPQPGTEALERHLYRCGTVPDRYEAPAPGAWRDHERFGGALLAAPLLGEVTAWLS